ncbi:MurR/RpiR family transcriptional regulator [Labrys wisconsinensis]|uniref:DNA-binding MurR/RpiR family transcriptional regulator n=1 Tax=Labrys wisconsinensis TaxID=425677 RepID=A0ABU0IZW3_9HYPH|nr:MurR/RpiR family transcriptional regulator [Labrys wisconsinensis]MDQ0467559.1 DNA-binding MurR/RpiR family transcriptional regulator [Labrys wisconsinensis]
MDEIEKIGVFAGPHPGPATLADRVVAGMASLSDAERRAARALLARYPTTGMETVSLFAERAKVSAPTILRFVAKLGFAGYAEFRRALREEMEAQAENPLTRPHVGSPPSTLSAFGQSLAETVQSSLAMASEADIERLADILGDARRQVFLLGGDFTEPASRHLEFHLRKMRGKVRVLSQGLLRRADELAEIQRRDVVILFDIRRYQADTIRTAQVAKERRAVVALFTDQWMSDAAEIADIVLRARVNVPSPWDSLIGIVALVEALALALDARQWAVARARFETIEAVRARLLG